MLHIDLSEVAHNCNQSKHLTIQLVHKLDPNKTYLRYVSFNNSTIQLTIISRHDGKIVFWVSDEWPGEPNVIIGKRKLMA